MAVNYKKNGKIDQSMEYYEKAINTLKKYSIENDYVTSLISYSESAI